MMTYKDCIAQLQVLVDATEPIDQTDAIQKFAAACILVERATKEDETARGQFGVFLDYYEGFALDLKDSQRFNKSACTGELTKLPLRLNK